MFMAADYHRHDISDAAWERIRPHTIGEKGTWGGNAKDTRQFINGVFWVLRTGAPWRDLPPDYGKWNTVHRWFCRWRDKGIWENILDELIRDADFEWPMFDTTHVVGGNQAMRCIKGGFTARCILPWMRMVCRSESLLQKVTGMIAEKLVH